MTFAPPEVSRVARRRIGVANAVLWIVASIVLTIVGATAAYSFVVVPYTGGGILGVNDFPWDAEEPLVATGVGGVWGAEASGVIRIPASQFSEAVEATIVGGGEALLYRTDPALGLTYTDDYFYAGYLGYVAADESIIIVPSDDDLELWVAAEGAWQLRLEPIEATVMGDDGASGTESGYLIYTGDAVSANFVYIGDGIFFVTIYTAFTQDSPIIETDDVSQRVSWDPDDYVVFEIESTQGAWTIDIDELAQPSQTPSPTTTPTETP